MTIQEVADKLVQYCKRGDFETPISELYSPDIVSVEPGAPPGQSREAKGIAAVRAKGEWWVANHEVHSSTVEGPLVAASHFAVKSYWMSLSSRRATASRWRRSRFTK
jgi:hypothetical protein